MCGEEDRSKWSADKKLEWLVDRLKDKIHEYNSRTTDGYYYDENDYAYDDARNSAYSDAADDIEWLLRPLGLME